MKNLLASLISIGCQLARATALLLGAGAKSPPSMRPPYKTMIDLSVLLPVYNPSTYPKGWVERAINSVLWEQPDIEVELCIGDDGSYDKWLDRLTDERIHIVKVGERPTGGSQAANAAAGIAQGKYFIILSCRSWYEPRSLTAMVKFLDSHPNIGFVYGDVMKYSQHGGASYKQARPYNKSVLLQRFPTSFGYMYRRECWDNGARYGCDVYAEKEGRWVTIGDHFLLAQIVLQGWDGFAMTNLMTLHYQYGGVEQSNDLLSKYKPKLMKKFNKLLGV